MYHRGVPLIGGIAALAGKRVAVFGAGMEGQSFARRVGPSCAELVIVDDAAAGVPGYSAPRRASAAEIAEFGVEAPSVLEGGGFDFVVHSPGVSRYDERLAAAAELGAVVTTPTALWLEDFQDRRVVAVTGSKGKTTTAMLTAAALRAYGLDVALAGNIGRPVTELYDDDGHDVFVVELSSFQTADVTTSPSVGVLTLLSPDHLDWHRNLANYFDDKLRLFSHREDVPVAVNGCATRLSPGRRTSSAGSFTATAARFASAAGLSSSRAWDRSISGGSSSSVSTILSTPAAPSRRRSCSPATRQSQTARRRALRGDGAPVAARADRRVRRGDLHRRRAREQPRRDARRA